VHSDVQSHVNSPQPSLPARPVPHPKTGVLLQMTRRSIFRQHNTMDHQLPHCMYPCHCCRSRHESPSMGRNPLCLWTKIKRDKVLLVRHLLVIQTNRRGSHGDYLRQPRPQNHHHPAGGSSSRHRMSGNIRRMTNPWSTPLPPWHRRRRI
jgi:hypothetical protein